MARYATGIVAVLLIGAPAFAQARLQLDDSCTVSVGNQTALVRPDGTFFVRNISVFLSAETGVAPQLYRVRATCLRSGEMLTGQSEFFSLSPGRTTIVADVFPTELDPIPVSITATAPTDTIALGETVQLAVVQDRRFYPETQVDRRGILPEGVSRVAFMVSKN